MTIIIGLTGSIATGKSTISRMFEELNMPVVDADKIARDLVRPGEEALKQIADIFGKDILHDDGSLNRQALGAIVFKDQEKLTALNEIMHPAIRNEMNRQKQYHIDNKAEVVVMDIPLLFENKLEHLVEKIIVVSVDESVQLDRLMKRDNSTKEEALSRINSQIPIKEKEKRAHAVINNNGTVEESNEQLIHILEKWQINIQSQD